MSNREHEEREAAQSHEAEENAADLSHEEEVDVEERRAPPARIVHEVIRRQGIEELERPDMSLLWSAIIAGVSLSMSVLAKAVLDLRLPESAAKPVLVDLGYTVGFVIVIMGRLQLFTESTITAILPLVTTPSWHSLGRTARLWLIVFLANMAGTFAFALFSDIGGFGSAELKQAIIAVSEPLRGRDAGNILLAGIPSGFLIATIVWVMPSSAGQRIWVIMLITWVIALGHLSHVVAGAAEAWVLWLAGAESLGWVIFHFILPALAGNIIGGTALFAFLAHAQVKREIHE
ncbi:formate/nitrite transporter family protein [Stakelama saccharophila]|uniref:Formate/nitrite transporter family protein n=1 Tax=Stakelama saccharophila TaxID=3075605 RepID=A0ABZ0B7B6_9SPHN|nr:formate/nitrite transporter family protein [Stakelama sp. W311]WNO53317.1 formate/nitrite transporter family protein [Stakelama sp. W311]